MQKPRPTKVSKPFRVHVPVFARAIIIAGVFAVSGVALLRLGSAATFTAPKEVETATLAGAASAYSTAAASEGAAVLFGAAAPSTPTNLVAYTGGESIALRWDADISTRDIVNSYKEYEVYRNGSLVKTVPANGDDVSFHEERGMGTVDADVTKGTTYSYQVRTVSKSGGKSPLSAPLSVLHPTNAFPTPTITIDTSKAAHMSGYVHTKLVPYIRTWYPKIAMQVAVPHFNPPSSFRLYISTTTPSGGANPNFSWNINSDIVTLSVNPDWMQNERVLLANQPSMIALVMQARSNPVFPAGWVNHQAAYWVTTSMQRTNGIVTAPQAGQRYSDMANPTGQFMEYVRTKYHHDIVKLINAAIVGNRYSDNLFVQYTGKTLAQLQAEWQPVAPKGPSLIKFSAYANKCLDNNRDGGKTDFRAQIWDCNSTGPQMWSAYHQADGSFSLRSVNYCLLAQTEERGGIEMWHCSGSSKTLWKQTANGSLVSQAEDPELFGKCLETPNGNTAGGTKLVLAPCDGSSKQLFTQIPR